MRSNYLLALALVLPSIGYAANNLDTLEKKASYSIGVDFLSRMKSQGAQLDVNSLIQGLKDGEAGNKTALTADEMTQALKDFQAKVASEKTEKQNKIAADNLATGKAFLGANAKKEGVITTKSGLQYKVIKAGEGAMPTADDTVVTHYKGTLIDGQEFDNSYKRKQPATFPVNGVIKGWTEALQLMKVGAKWQLFIPSEIAYGESKRGKIIQANSTLVFDIELLEIKAAK